MTDNGHKVFPINQCIESNVFSHDEKIAVKHGFIEIKTNEGKRAFSYEFWIDGVTQIITDHTSYLLSKDGQTIERYGAYPLLAKVAQNGEDNV